MSENGIRLGSIGRTELFVQPGFFILAAFFVLLDLQRNEPIQVALLWIPILLISVLFHEIGHAFANSVLGFGPSTIALGGFGGVTMSQRSHGRPWQNLLASLAGPLFSFLLAFVVKMLFVSVPFFHTDAMMIHFMPLMYQANIVWGIFNLLPIYPLDGGSVLRNFLLFFSSERRAFVISVWLSMILAALVIAGALMLRSFFLAIIAAMLLMQNYQRWMAHKDSGSD